MELMGFPPLTTCTLICVLETTQNEPFAGTCPWNCGSAGTAKPTPAAVAANTILLKLAADGALPQRMRILSKVLFTFAVSGVFVCASSVRVKFGSSQIFSVALPLGE